MTAAAGAAQPPAPGEKAPDFTLPDHNLQPVRLSEALAKGPAVLAFFPAAFTSVCTKEMCTFRDSVAELNKSRAQVFGISVDMPFSLKAWAEQQGLNFPLLSDFNKEVIRAYGVVIPELLGLKDIARRAVFVIDPSGTIRHREVLEDARNEPDYAKVHAALAALA